MVLYGVETFKKGGFGGADVKNDGQSRIKSKISGDDCAVKKELDWTRLR